MSVDANQFGSFLEAQREQRKIDREKLGEGLYSDCTMGRLERGERYPDKMTRDRLLARLGESGYDYECFLLPTEYADWLERQQILDSLDNLELKKAEQLLIQYEEKHSREDKVSCQFLLTMRLQWMELKKDPEEARIRMVEQAVKLTVPRVDTGPLPELVLSLPELNLVLEYINYKEPPKAEKKYRQLLDYIQLERFDPLSRAMLGSKIALCYCGYREKTEVAEQARKMEENLAICNLALDWLREANKIFNALELLQKKEKYLCRLLENRDLLSEKVAKEYDAELQQTKEFYAVIRGLYEQFDIPQKTNGYTCFYREREVYCINDVIRIRRRMLGISATELEEEGVCTKRTLVRLENKKTNPQTALAQRVFRRLNLSMELHRAQIITDKQEALRMEEQYREAFNQGKYGQAEFLLQKIKQIIPMDDRINQQYIFGEENGLLFADGKINREEYIERAVNALEMTIPLEVALAELKPYIPRHGKRWEGEKYLTNMEITILKSIANKVGTKEENEYWKILKEYYAWMEKQCTIAPILSMYSFVMTSVASCIGNEGRYEESNVINNKILKESLRARSVSYVSRNMYGLMWNDRKQKGLPMSKEDPEWCGIVQKCLIIDLYCNNTWHAAFMKKKLE